jgi:hypothetical protein
LQGRVRGLAALLGIQQHAQRAFVGAPIGLELREAEVWGLAVQTPKMSPEFPRPEKNIYQKNAYKENRL